MPRLIDIDRRVADLVVGVVRVLVARGIPGLTMRTIARESGISTGSLLHHFDTRERMLGVAVHRIGRTLVSTAEFDSQTMGVEAFLPVDDEMKRLTRAWLACCELWRSEPWLIDIVANLRARERRALSALHADADPEDLDVLVLLVDGLRAACCAPAEPMSLERGRDILRDASGRLTLGGQGA